MTIEVLRPTPDAPPAPASIWEVRLLLVPGSPVPQGWDSRCLVYRFETRAAAEAFARLKVDSAGSDDDHGLLAISPATLAEGPWVS